MSEAEISKQPAPPLDYNFPMPGRKDLMSMDVIKDGDVNLKKFKQLHTARDWSVNLYNLDIPGTAPKRVGAFNHKEDFVNKSIVFF